MTNPAALAIGVSTIGFLVQSGLVAWAIWSVRKIAREEVDAVAKQLTEALKVHDRDAMSHPNHHMTPVIQALQIEITRTLARLEGKVETLGSEVSSLRKAHDEAVARGNCLYQQLDDKRGDR